VGSSRDSAGNQWLGLPDPGFPLLLRSVKGKLASRPLTALRDGAPGALLHRNRACYAACPFLGFRTDGFGSLLHTLCRMLDRTTYEPL
jgi:hypothetical protein